MASKEIKAATALAVKAGRPSKYKKKYNKEIIELGKKGYLSAMMAAEFKVCKQTLHEWAEVFPEFSDAFNIARTYAEAFNERNTLSAETIVDLNKAKWIASGYFQVAEVSKQEVKQDITADIGLHATVSFGDRDELQD